MKISKSIVKRIIESYLFEEKEKSEEKKLKTVKVNNMTSENIEGNFVLNYNDKKIDVIITNTKSKEGILARSGVVDKSEILSFLSIALTYADREQIENLLEMCITLEVLEAKDKETIIDKLSNISKPIPRSKTINTVLFKTNKDRNTIIAKGNEIISQIQAPKTTQMLV